VVTLAGRVPSRGELIGGPGDLEFEVLDADPRRVKRVRIHSRSAATPGEADAPPAVVPALPPSSSSESPDRDLPRA
jgi:hypothetical protein